MKIKNSILLLFILIAIFTGCSQKKESSKPDYETVNKIITAINDHDKTKLDKFASDFDINQRDSSGVTILNHAIQKDRNDLVAILLKHGADPDFHNEDDFKTTPLMECSNNGNVDMARLLIGKGADVNIQDKNGDPVIHWTAYYGDTAYTKLLLEHNAKMDLKSIHSDNVMQVALKEYQYDIVNMFLRENKTINPVSQNQVKFIDAVLKQDDKFLKRNLNESTVNIRDGAGNTLLMIASQTGFYNGVMILIENKVSVNDINSVGHTALNLAVYFGYPDIVDFLLEHGADVNKTDERFMLSPLAAAARQNRVTIGQTLISHGADINATDGINNFTPIVWATLHGHADFVKMLLDYNPDLSVVSKYESTVFEMTKDEEILKLLNSAK